jgi:hypothetical protein
MFETAKMKASVHEKKRNAFADTYIGGSCFALGLSHIQEDFTLMRVKRKRKHVGRVILFPCLPTCPRAARRRELQRRQAVLAIYAFRESVAAHDE